MTKPTQSGEIRLLLDVVDQAFGTRAWHGTTLRGALRGLTAEQALWRPNETRHNIWDLVLHAAYWKYIVTRRITGDRTLNFPRRPSNWPIVPAAAGQGDFRSDVNLLTAQHQQLRDAIAAFPSSRLWRRAPGSKWRYSEFMHGIAAHDLYHAGQIQLLKRLYGERGT